MCFPLCSSNVIVIYDKSQKTSSPVWYLSHKLYDSLAGSGTFWGWSPGWRTKVPPASGDELTCNGDVGSWTCLSWCGLAPVHSTVPAVSFVDNAGRCLQISPVVSTLWNSSGCFGLHFPPRGFSVLFTAQRERLILKELRSVRRDCERGCREDKQQPT